ncbi:MAG: oligoribonuclease [Desulfobulbus sp.]
MDRMKNLIWLDMEMTGLTPADNVILELATIVTDNELNELAQGPVIAIHQPEAVLACMDDWCQNQHGGSGLLTRVKKSVYTCRQAELETLEFVKQWVEPRTSPLCGNSVWHDRRFLARFMPELERYFHYRNIDVSTLKELAYRWRPQLKRFEKGGQHLALEDIKESIAELRYYRKHFFAI